MAYQGFERGIEEDAHSVRLFVEKCPEVIVASSCSKNFAVYRERTGAISVVGRDARKTADVVTVINSLTRKNYSMPPTHGPGIIDIILHDEELTALWRSEVDAMRERINGLRGLLAGRIAAAGIQRDYSFLERQSGMFSFMGLNVEQVQRRPEGEDREGQDEESTHGDASRGVVGPRRGPGFRSGACATASGRVTRVEF